MYQFLKLYAKTAAAAAVAAAEEIDPHSSSPSLVLEDEEGTAKSFHYLLIPDFYPARLNWQAEAQVATLQQVIDKGHVVREQRNLSLKNPATRVVVVCSEPEVRASQAPLSSYLYQEISMRNLCIYIHYDETIERLCVYVVQRIVFIFTGRNQIFIVSSLQDFVLYWYRSSLESRIGFYYYKYPLSHSSSTNV